MNLTLDFGETADAVAPATAASVAVQPTSAIQKLAARLEEAMQEPGSPIRAIHHQPAKAAVWAPFPGALNPLLRKALAERGIENLYSHQAAAVESSLAGKNTVVVTPTASGKTLCYNLPVVHSILANPAARALYLFPTTRRRMPGARYETRPIS
jgi:DEAD/DEAH box helicase domain-containing protein